LYAEITNNTFDRACYDYLMNRNIKIKHFQNERPITDYYKNLQERNIPIIAQFLTSIMMKYNDILELNATEFFNIYKNFLNENGFTKFETNTTKFGLELSQFNSIIKIRTSKYIKYKINITELRNQLINEKYYVPNSDDNVVDYDDDDDDDDVKKLNYGVSDNNNVDILIAENNELKKQISELQKMIKQLQKQNNEPEIEYITVKPKRKIIKKQTIIEPEPEPEPNYDNDCLLILGEIIQ